MKDGPMQAMEESLESIFGTMAILAISIAVVLAIVGIVLFEICWVVRLWTDLSKHWHRSPNRVPLERRESQEAGLNK
jgi:hypothetical protein